MESFSIEPLESRALLSSTSLPPVYSVDPSLIANSKAQLAAGHKTLLPALNALVSSANSDLKITPVAVTDKKNPSGFNAHDYVSYARYYWPNPKTKSGLPYIDIDGKVNTTQVNQGDDPLIGKMLNAVSDLANAFYFTGTESYADHAVQMIQTWFLNPKTMMNPNLNHAQIALGNDTGRYYGIIDAREMYMLVDALGLLSSSTAWSKSTRTGMTSWLTQYESWLSTSSFGKEEAAAPNNHGTWYDVQQMSILLYLGKTSDARTLAGAFGSKRINTEIKSDGSQPLELSRADGWAYSIFNLQAMELMANLASRVSVNLWTYQGSSGGSIQKAINYLAPYANSKTAWKHNHLSGTPLSQSNRNQLIPLLLEGQAEYGNLSKWLAYLPASTVTANETNLFVDA